MYVHVLVLDCKELHIWPFPVRIEHEGQVYEATAADVLLMWVDSHGGRRTPFRDLDGLAAV